MGNNGSAARDYLREKGCGELSENDRKLSDSIAKADHRAERAMAAVNAEMGELWKNLESEIPVASSKWHDEGTSVSVDAQTLNLEVDKHVNDRCAGFDSGTVNVIKKLAKEALSAHDGDPECTSYYCTTMLDSARVRLDLCFFASGSEFTSDCCDWRDNVLAWAFSLYVVDSSAPQCDLVGTGGRGYPPPTPPPEGQRTEALSDPLEDLILEVAHMAVSTPHDPANLLGESIPHCVQLESEHSANLAVGVDTGLLKVPPSSKLTLFYRFTATNCSPASFREACSAWGGALPQIRFEECPADRPAHFTVADSPTDDKGCYAKAFWPSDLAGRDMVHLWAFPLLKDSPNQIGFLTHEVGHILGFHHEHIFFAWEAELLSATASGLSWGVGQGAHTDEDAHKLHAQFDRSSVMSFLKVFSDLFRNTVTRPSAVDLELAAAVYKSPEQFELSQVYTPMLHQ
eukprot:TRINITY_DN453_c1_g1_i4.p1 TRINITY_DN453_c1_g1~~TRINITY_DN453_c1_g1_i4.p1  ORF type:complete len:457 (+),score=78.08 TRINITY_DN453_c1_g1_i4:1031-2401(+)